MNYDFPHKFTIDELGPRQAKDIKNEFRKITAELRTYSQPLDGFPDYACFCPFGDPDPTRAPVAQKELEQLAADLGLSITKKLLPAFRARVQEIVAKLEAQRPVAVNGAPPPVKNNGLFSEAAKLNQNELIAEGGKTT